MPLTLKDIARKVGVAESTVSRAINNKPGVGKKTRQKIMKIVEKHDFKPNQLAQGLANLNHLKVDPFPPPTNIILLSLKEGKADTEDFLQHLESHGIQAIPFGKDLIRMVIHKDINDRDINYVLNTVSAYLKTFS